MSKERELLESCLDEIQYHEVPCPELVTRIKELLAQPEHIEDDQYYKHIKEHKEQIEDDFREQQSEEKWYANSLGVDDENI